MGMRGRAVGTPTHSAGGLSKGADLSAQGHEERKTIQPRQGKARLMHALR